MCSTCKFVMGVFAPPRLKLILYSFIVMASTNEFARKILNSPNHAEPCLVYSAKQILRPDNWYVAAI